LMKILDNLKTIEVNKVVESYEKWLQPKYDADWIIDVIKITNLKNQYINFLETEKVSQEYYNSLSEEKKLKENDIIICATWKGSLWKIDLFESENEAITSVDNYIIRLKQNINFLFFVYFFRSILWYFQIERDYTWTTNQIHLYWEQIWDFKIPNISFKEQQRIVNEIKFELDKQEQIRKDIEKERSKIDELIEESIRNFW
jgi:type I restriction enzyme S subunit